MKDKLERITCEVENVETGEIHEDPPFSISPLVSS